MKIEIERQGDYVKGAVLTLTPIELLLIHSALARAEIGNFHRRDVEAAHEMSKQIRKATEEARNGKVC